MWLEQVSDEIRFSLRREAYRLFSEQYSKISLPQFLTDSQKGKKWSCNNKYNPLGSVLTSSLSPDTENVADYLSVTGKLDWMRELPYTSHFCSYYLFPITQKKVTEEFYRVSFCCLLGNIAYLMIRQFTAHLKFITIALFPFFYVITTVRWPSNIAYFRHTIHF